MPFFPSLKWGKGDLNFSFQLTKIVAYEVKYTKTRSYLGRWLFVQTRHPHYAVIDDSLAAHTEVPTHLPLATQVVNLKFTILMYSPIMGDVTINLTRTSLIFSEQGF